MGYSQRVITTPVFRKRNNSVSRILAVQRSKRLPFTHLLNIYGSKRRWTGAAYSIHRYTRG